MTVTDHISERDMRSFCMGALPAIETILCAEHLEVCPDCNLLFNQISRIGGASKTFDGRFPRETYILGRHLDYEKISDYLDNKLERDEIESVKLHLEFCQDCPEEISRLKEFRKSLEKELASEYPRQGFIKRLVSSIRKPRLPNPVYVFGVISVLILLSLIMIVINRQRGRGVNEPHLVKTTPTPFIVDGKKPEQPSSPKQTAANRQEFKSGRSSKTEIIYDNGKQFVVSYERGGVRISNLAPELLEDAAKVLQAQPVGDPALLEEVSQADGDVRGGNEKNKISLMSPVGTLIVEDRPVFKWRAVEGATAYVVDLVDEKFNPIARSPHLESTEWKVGASLKRDAIYQWQVTAFKGEEKIGDQLSVTGKFKIVSEQKVEEVQRARKKYISSFELGVFYLREGLMEEAEKELWQLQLRNPDSKLVEKIFLRN